MIRLYLIFLIIRAIVRSVFYVIWTAIKSTATAIITMWKTVPYEVDDMAVHWVGRTLNTTGFPNTGEQYLYWFYYFVAWGVFILGWLISAHLTIWLEHLIFR
jgi:hypothetical protein